MRAGRGAIALALVTLLGACERVIVEGRATNARGDALPGVVVRLGGTDRQDLSDGLGRYRLTARRDASSARLEFSKSGYARTELTVGLSGRLRVRPPDAALWPLPPNPGVYAVHDFRYEASDWVLPKRYYLKDGPAVFGIELPEQLHAVTADEEPFVVCFRTPRYNARLSRLAPAEATIPGIESGAIRIWIEDGAGDVALAPVDPADGNLLRIVADRPLQPGVYGVHWGAMEGYTTLESRVFAFRIAEPPAADEAEVPAGGEGEPAEGNAGTPDPQNGGAAAAGSAPPDAIEPPSEDTPPQE